MKSRANNNLARRGCGKCARMTQAHFRGHPGRNDRQSPYFRHQIAPRLTPGLTLSPKDRTWKSLRETLPKTRLVFLIVYKMQNLLRTLIVDSEAPARERLQDMLAYSSQRESGRGGNSAPSALSLYEDLHPNLVLMDVQIQGAMASPSSNSNRSRPSSSLRLATNSR